MNLDLHVVKMEDIYNIGACGVIIAILLKDLVITKGKGEFGSGNGLKIGHSLVYITN